MPKKTIVVALGGNALLKRSDPMTAGAQRANVQVAVRQLAPLASEYNLVLAHGNGPQVGLLALQAAAYTDVEPYPLDVLGAESQGMIAYMLEQELGNLVPLEMPIATILTMVEVDLADPAFQTPTKFVGPGYEQAEADALAERKGWLFSLDGEKWRRVVPSPEPKRIFEIQPIKWLIEKGCVVICAGGGGIPTAFDPEAVNRLEGVEAVIDKDYAASLLAREVKVDLFVILTAIERVYINFGKPDQAEVPVLTVDEARRHLADGQFPPGSMGPKIRAAVEYIEAGGREVLITKDTHLKAALLNRSGTRIVAAT